MSKGSTPRPLSVPQETFGERWEKAFGAGPRSPWVSPEMLKLREASIRWKELLALTSQAYLRGLMVK